MSIEPRQPFAVLNLFLGCDKKLARADGVFNSVTETAFGRFTMALDADRHHIEGKISNGD